MCLLIVILFSQVSNVGHWPLVSLWLGGRGSQSTIMFWVLMSYTNILQMYRFQIIFTETVRWIFFSTIIYQLKIWIFVDHQKIYVYLRVSPLIFSKHVPIALNIFRQTLFFLREGFTYYFTESKKDLFFILICYNYSIPLIQRLPLLVFILRYTCVAGSSLWEAVRSH